MTISRSDSPSVDKNQFSLLPDEIIQNIAILQSAAPYDAMRALRCVDRKLNRVFTRSEYLKKAWQERTAAEFGWLPEQSDVANISPEAIYDSALRKNVKTIQVPKDTSDIDAQSLAHAVVYYKNLFVRKYANKLILQHIYESESYYASDRPYRQLTGVFLQKLPSELKDYEGLARILITNWLNITKNDLRKNWRDVLKSKSFLFYYFKFFLKQNDPKKYKNIVKFILKNIKDPPYEAECIVGIAENMGKRAGRDQLFLQECLKLHVGAHLFSDRMFKFSEQERISWALLAIRLIDVCITAETRSGGDTREIAFTENKRYKKSLSRLIAMLRPEDAFLVIPRWLKSVFEDELANYADLFGSGDRSYAKLRLLYPSGSGLFGIVRRFPDIFMYVRDTHIQYEFALFSLSVMNKAHGYIGSDMLHYFDSKSFFEYTAFNLIINLNRQMFETLFPNGLVINDQQDPKLFESLKKQAQCRDAIFAYTRLQNTLKDCNELKRSRNEVDETVMGQPPEKRLRSSRPYNGYLLFAGRRQYDDKENRVEEIEEKSHSMDF